MLSQAGIIDADSDRERASGDVVKGSRGLGKKTHGLRLSSQVGAVYLSAAPVERRAADVRAGSWYLEQLGRGLSRTG